MGLGLKDAQVGLITVVFNMKCTIGVAMGVWFRRFMVLMLGDLVMHR